MEKSKLDRRIRYTKKLLEDALVSLMMNQHISGISVKALCEKADINRSTFYTYYKSPYDLLCQIEKEVTEKVKKYLEQQDFSPNKPLPEQVFTSILMYAKENRDLFMVLLGENSDYLFNQDILSLSQVIAQQYHLPLDNNIKGYLEAFGTAGCVSVFHNWLKAGTLEPPEEISTLVAQLLQNGISSLKDMLKKYVK